jgi:mono/diheme cytochrome c family protein
MQGKREEQRQGKGKSRGRCKNNDVSGFCRHVFFSLFPFPFSLCSSLFLLGLSVSQAQVPNGASPQRSAPDAAEQVKFFETQVKPILKANCFTCHGEGTELSGGLRLTSRAGILKGGVSGPAVTPAKPSESLLVRAINYQGRQMPPTGNLPQAQIAILTRWVAMGLPWTPGEAGAGNAPVKKGPPPVNAETMNFWSFRRVKRPPVPAVKHPGWVKNPIDAFVLANLERANLTPVAPAGKAALLRRATYDLIGLPPSPEEVQAFLADRSPNAYEKVVDRLLASPHYGERWGRHWLDLVRFAETNSFERDDPKPFAWRYRDYVIQALNQDKPYDRFLREQLAGDELEQVTPETLIATGYYRLGAWDDEPSDPEQARYDELDDIVATTGQVFLGLTVNCARCHDHKLDPIPQKDYYRLLAFFQGINSYGVRSAESVAANSLRPIAAEADRNQNQLLKSPPQGLDRALCVTEGGRVPPPTFVLLRGNPHVPGEKVEPGFPSVLAPPAPDIRAPGADAPSSGRRTALANWIVSQDNPLTARVMVNRLWQHHFGRGIVRSPSNFGSLGTPPTHPELLDWLASEFVRNGWRLKPLHKLMMMSSTYLLSSQADPKALAQDPENDLCWRFNMRRLDAEEIRDSILAVNGSLNLKMGGPGIYPTIPPEVLAGQSRPGYGWEKSSPEERARRSVYIHIKRSLAVPLLASFDAADTDFSCPVRFATTQPTQALGMMNSAFLNEQAQVFADYLQKHAGQDATAQVALALRRTLQREPTAKEIARGVKFLRTMQAEHRVSAEEALRCWCIVALNLDEFIYLD